MNVMLSPVSKARPGPPIFIGQMWDTRLSGGLSHVPKSEGHGAPRFSSVRQMGT
jgi:hypothetical protein